MKYVILILMVSTVFACNSSNHSENISIVEKYVKSVENLDYTNMESILADNYRGYGPSAEDSIGKIAALENWKNNVENLYQKIEYTRSQFAGVTIKDGLEKGDWIANWAELTIEYKDGKGTVKIWANSNYMVENGKIVKSITFYNEADVLRQLGYVLSNPNGL
jgi:limonene-1,2-epoxide hydrolase